MLAAMSIVGGDDRVSAAYNNVEETLRLLCKKTEMSFPPKRIYLRAFKRDAVLEVWAASSGTGRMRLLKSYPIAAMSGSLGPKRKEGDYQVPEGFYHIERFNPRSQFHLSLGINYPNASDRILSDQEHPGSDIFIHGDRKSIGCMAMTDPVIEEIYVLADLAKKAGQKNIPVHIYPFRFNEEWALAPPSTLSLWKSMRPIYDAFEKNRQVPRFRVLNDGRYQILTKS